jgi:diaminopimelate decarboxylase
MNYQHVEFERAFGLTEQISECVGPEIVFTGRSNVGKSSLLNRLFNRKALARVSSMPGKTITVNFYRVGDVRFVDLPGYGYAKAAKNERRRLQELLQGYFSQPQRIALVFMLVDMRHKPTPDDLFMVNSLIDNEIPFVIVLTKSDKLKKRQRKERMEALASEFPCAEQLTMIPFSAETGEGVESLHEIIKDITSTEESETMFVSKCLSTNAKGRLAIGGVDSVDLAEKYGTPLYVMDETTIRETLREFKDSIEQFYGGCGQVAYASKAFACKEIYRIAKEEQCGIDVVSYGELYTALSVDFPADQIFFHGNNKTPKELDYAIEQGVGRIVVDNLTELKTLSDLAVKRNKTVAIMMRIKPGIDAHTHDFVRTGQIDSKFGFALETGEAMEAVRFVLEHEGVDLVGLHCHIGSQIFDIDPFELAAKVMLDFMAQIKSETGLVLKELNLGGGFGIRYIPENDPAPYRSYMQKVSDVVHQACKEKNLALPNVIIEPGRSVVGPSGITLYTVGAVKEIPNIRTYVSIDGGMTDNPRYILYGSKYDAVVANRADQPRDSVITLAGRCCESGDLIGENMIIQTPKEGDIIAVMATGAYNYAMASNYNRNPRPAVVMVNNGSDRLIVRRESLEDLVRNDI